METELEILGRFWSRTINELESVTGPFRSEYEGWPDAMIYNGWFEAGDIELYHCVLRALKPKRVVEVGAGFSSRVAMEALRKNEHGTLVVIDPSPRTALPDGTEHLKKRVEQVDVTFFASLEANDVLFIDSSHTAEEARHHVGILELLAEGVVVHHHDCFFPYEARHPEETVLRSYYSQQRDRWEGLVNNALARHVLGAEGYTKVFPAYGRDTVRIPGSIYTRKRSAR